jgi:hypothetical protein
LFHAFEGDVAPHVFGDKEDAILALHSLPPEKGQGEQS